MPDSEQSYDEDSLRIRRLSMAPPLLMAAKTD